MPSSITNYQLPLTAFLLIGAQGSGKSTWAEANAARLNAEIVASDEIRNELEGAGRDATNLSDEVFAILEQRVDQLLAQGRNVIVDATHARRKWRENVLAIARARGARRVAIWFDVPLEAALARNAARPGGPWGRRIVPAPVLIDAWAGLEPPAEGEFDEVLRITEAEISV
jgi:predicted kinase